MVPAVRGLHRLVAGRCWVEDAQASMPKDQGAKIEDAPAIRPAMGQYLRHCRDGVRVWGRSVERQDPGNAAHVA